MSVVAGRSRTFALVVVSLLSWTERAAASGPMLPRFGAEHGHPTTANPTAVYYNPAALTLGTETRVYVEGQLGSLHMTYERPGAPTDAPDPPDAQGANTGTAQLDALAFAPGVAGKMHFGQLALGLGLYVPLGGVVDFDKNERFRGSPYPSAYDGVQRFSIVGGRTAWTYVTAAAAYTFGEPRLSVGLSVNLIRGTLKADAARTTAGDNNLMSETRLLTDVSDWRWSFGVGALYEAIERQLWFGASYQSRPRGDTMSGDFRQSIAGNVSTQAADFRYKLPDIARLGARFAPSERVELRLFGDYTRWSVHDRLCLTSAGEPCDLQENGAPAEGAHVLANLPRNWDDAFGVRAGGSFWLVPELEVFVGAGFDSNPIPDATLDSTSMFGASVSGALRSEGLR
jgi:long-chain fatty acid transport protein